ncbi:ATP-binding protein [Comamonas endophytica]|uniref:histidine kinase n=1 Tax=Comamonas endophytica TaxID=2949090 RepID=A0ABY6G731_9BURK|nr:MULTISPECIES: ATP-binding protein [unclassified Acidovorax]MCD2511449.1 ATP-binding protein [Acidovorax sp. D4N7]UYG50840.1 ATP-binding protein [Acidovorax sp. 5MLIR]
MYERLRATERALEVITKFHEVAIYCARQSSNRHDCLQRVLEAATTLAYAGAGSLHVFGAQRDTPEFLDCQLDAAAAALLRSPCARDAAALAAAALQQSHLHTPRLDGLDEAPAAHRPWLELLREAGLQSVVSLPLRTRTGELLGMLALFYPWTAMPGEAEIGILQLLAHQAGDYLERQDYHRAVAENEERLRLFLGATSEVVYCMGPDWSEIRHLQGRGFLPDVHAPTDHWMGRYIPDQDQPAVRQAIREAVEQKSVFEMEHPVIRVDGSMGWAHSRAMPVLDADGEVVEWFGAASDITARKEAEQALRLSQQRYHTLFDSIDEGYCVIRMEFDAEGKGSDYIFLEVNQAFERHTGIQDAVGRSMRAIAPEHEEWWFEVYGEIAKTGESRRFEFPAEALNRYYDVYAFRIGAPGEHQVAVLFKDISERQRFELEQRQASQRKDEFLAILAHELRNPLAPVRSGLNVLQLSQGDPATVARLLPMLQRQVDHMVRLVDDLLEVSRISGGKVELRPEPVELAAALHGAVDTCRPLLDARHHRLVLDLPGEVLRVHADPVRLSQIIANLLNNAAKYTDQGGRICLRAERDGNDALIVVEDNGRGISQDMLPRIFDLFAQAAQTSNMAQGGIGIGLTLVRGLVEMQGGSVEAQSAGPGQGSVFTVRLPLLLAPALPEPPAPFLGPADVPALERRRVLVVDDNVDAAEGLSMLLDLLGMEVRTAHDGASGLKAAAEFTPGLVLLDIGMPDMDGYELARRLRAAHGAQCPTLVVVSGWGQPEDRQRSMDAGVDAHLVKPVGLEQLQEVLKLVQ